MLQNDLSYVLQDFSWPFPSNGEEIKSIIKGLLQKHLDESVAGPYLHRIYDLEEIEDELPGHWQLIFDEETKLKSKTLRIYVYNKYEDAARNLESSGESATLKASHLNDEFWVVNSIEYEGDDPAPLELDCAKGESLVSIGFEAFFEDRFYTGEFDPRIIFTRDGEDSVIIDEDDLAEIAHEIKETHEEMMSLIK